MADLYLVAVDTATGTVTGEWRGDSEHQPTAPEGVTFVDAAPHGTGPFLGRHWTGTDFDPAPAVEATRMTRLEFRDLFTSGERAAIRAMVAAEDADVVDASEAMQMAQYVDRADPRVGMYLLMLVAKGALTVERRDQILAGQAPA
jgi:hypothetical protein